MSVLVQLAWMLLLAAVCCGPALADEYSSKSDLIKRQPRVLPADLPGNASGDKNARISALPQISSLGPSREGRDQKRTTSSQEPFGLQTFDDAPSDLLAKWADVQSRILSEEETLAACRSDERNCPASARRFLNIIELGRQREGFARLAEINRAVNLSVKPMSDKAQYGVEDFWSAPLATLSAGAGDCEDYAILKFVALREAGIMRDDLRLVIVHDLKRSTDHALLAVHLQRDWLLLDNRMLVMINATEAGHYHPLFVLDDRGVREFATAIFAPPHSRLVLPR